MANISLKKDYMDGNVLYGKDLNPNFELIETTINANDDAQSATNASVNSTLTQLSSDMTQAKTDISEMKGDIVDLETSVLDIPTKTSELENDSGFVNSSAIPTKVSDLTNDSNFVSEDAVPTKISQLENDDNTVKDADYVHTDNNYTDDEKTKLAGLSNYVLPMASSSVLGGVKLGEGLTRESDGTINVTGGGASGNSVPTLVGTQETPIELYNLTDGDNKVPLGLAYISGYTKELNTSEANNNYDGCLLYTDDGGSQFIGPDYEKIGTSLNLVFWFRPSMIEPSTGYYGQSFVKFTYNNTITNTEQGYTTPKAVYDYVGALASLNTTDKTSIVNAINEIMENVGGENGATFTPDVSSDGTLSWTNDKGLPNPDPVNIKGPQGDTGATGATGADGADGLSYLIYRANPNLTTGIPEIGDECYLIDGYFNRPPEIGDECLAFYQSNTGYNTYILIMEITGVGSASRHKGVVRNVLDVTGADGADGTDGQGVPTGGTEGQVLAKNSATDFDTVWKTLENGGGFTELVGTEEEPYDLSTGPDEPGIYLIKGYYKTNPSSSTTYNAQGGIFLFNTLWNFENRQEADQGIARIMMDMNKGFRVKINNKTKNVANTYWITYQLNPVNSISSTTGSTAESMSTALFVDLTGINSSTNLSSLQTTDKSSLIAAINELNTRLAALENPTE